MRSRGYLFPLARLCVTHNISQLARSVWPPFDQAAMWVGTGRVRRTPISPPVLQLRGRKHGADYYVGVSAGKRIPSPY